MSVDIEKYVIPVAKGVSIMEGWYDLEPDHIRFKMYLRGKLVELFGSEKLEEELRSMNREKLYSIIREISAQFLEKKL